MTSNSAHGIGFCDQHKIMETTKCCISQFAKIVHVNQLFYCNKCVTGTLPYLRLYRNHRMFITTFADYISGVLIQLRLVENWLKIERSQDQIPWGTLLFREKKIKTKKTHFLLLQMHYIGKNVDCHQQMFNFNSGAHICNYPKHCLHPIKNII